jgi:hypothetical protein
MATQHNKQYVRAHKLHCLNHWFYEPAKKLLYTNTYDLTKEIHGLNLQK